MTRWFERVGQLEHRLDLVLDHAADRNAGPVLRRRDATACSSTLGRISGVSPCSCGELRLQRLQLGQQRLRAPRASAAGGRRGVARRRALVCAVGDDAAIAARRLVALELAPRAALPRALRRRAAWRAARGSGRPAPSPRSSAPRASPAASSSCGSLRLGVASARSPTSMPIASSRPMISELGLERLDAAAAVLDLGRHRVLADGDARAGGVEQAHRLVGQLARRDVAVRELDRRLDRLVEDLRRCGASRAPTRRRAS